MGETLKGMAEFRISGNDMFWSCCISDWNGETYEFYHISWSGYNDANWWGNVAPKQKIKDVVGDKGTTKTFEIDFNTCEVKMH